MAKLMGKYLQPFVPNSPNIRSLYLKSIPGRVTCIQSKHLQIALTNLYRRHYTVGWAGA
jgi:hypothetical protein